MSLFFVPLITKLSMEATNAKLQSKVLGRKEGDHDQEVEKSNKLERRRSTPRCRGPTSLRNRISVHSKT